MKKKVFLAAAFAASIVGCAAPQQPAPVAQRLVIPFPAAEYAALPKTGTAAVTGQAFMKTVGGDVKLGAGSAVVIYPATSYTVEYWRLVNEGHNVEPDKSFGATARKTVADAQGRFSFANLPPGDYFIHTKITWMAASGYQGRHEEQGGAIVKRIALRDGAVTEVMLTR